MSNDILSLIADAVREVLPEPADRDIRGEDSLEDLGANSMDRAEIIMIVLERLDLEIPLVDTFGPQNLGELAELLREKTSLGSK